MLSYCWDKPLCLVYSSASKGLEVNKRTIDLLKKVNVPVTVVAIAGAYRTGKSYLMNRLAGTNTGFDLGSTIQAKTKGIWAWCRPHPISPDTCLLLLDTEGLGDPEKGDKNHDAWIFSLAVLLGTTLIYNSMATINQDALNDLHLVTKLSEHVKVKSGNDSQNFDEFFPSFIWAIRDFWLDLELDDRPCTSDDYMEHMLKLKTGDDPRTAEYNRVRQCLRRYFPSRKCFTFPRPVKDMDKMRNPEYLKESDFDPEFLKTSERFINHLFNVTSQRMKTIYGAPLTGSALAGLCDFYVKRIQEGGIPCIENAVESVSKSENMKAVEEALDYYKTELIKIPLPTDTVEQLSIHHQECEKDAIEKFIKASMFDIGQEYQGKLSQAILTEYQAFYANNEVISQTICKELLLKLYATVAHQLKSDVYTKPGGYEIYKKDLDNVEARYNAEPGKGVKAVVTLKEFMDEKTPQLQAILAADEKLTAQQKEIEDRKRREQEAKRKAEAHKAEEEKMRKLLQDREKHHKENIKQLSDKLHKEMLNKLGEQEAQMNRKIIEQERCLKEGFKKDADALNGEITNLKKSVDNQKQMMNKAQSGGIFTKVGNFFDKLFRL